MGEQVDRELRCGQREENREDIYTRGQIGEGGGTEDK